MTSEISERCARLSGVPGPRFPPSTGNAPLLDVTPCSPLPIETVRDLLGIVRALYALHRSKGNYGHARALQNAGTQLRRALALAVHTEQDSEANARDEAWRLANQAIVTVARVQGNFADDLGAIVRLASERVKRIEIIDRQARRRDRIKRG